VLTNTPFSSSQREESAPTLITLYSIILSTVSFSILTTLSHSKFILGDSAMSKYINFLREDNLLSSLTSHTLLTNLFSLLPTQSLPYIASINIFFVAITLLSLIFAISIKLRIYPPSLNLFFLLLISLLIINYINGDFFQIINLLLYFLSLLFIFFIIAKLGSFFWTLSPLLLVFGILPLILGLASLLLLLKITPKINIPSYLMIKNTILLLLVILTTITFIGSSAIFICLAFALNSLFLYFKLNVNNLITLLFVGILFISFVSKAENISSREIYASELAISKVVYNENILLVKNKYLNKLQYQSLLINLGFHKINSCKLDSCGGSYYQLEVISFENFNISDSAIYYPYLPGYLFKLVLIEK